MWEDNKQRDNEMIAEKDIVCKVCKKNPPEKVDCWPTWFGRYHRGEMISAICIDCIKDNKDKWREGKI